MAQVEQEVVRPVQLVLPVATTSQRDAYQAEIGTIIYDSTTGLLSYCIGTAAGSGSWYNLGTTA